MMCAEMKVSRSGYYEWRDRPESATAARRGVLLAAITVIFHRHQGRYGHRRVHEILRRQGRRCSVELVPQLMAQAGLRAFRPRKWQGPTPPCKKAPAGGAGPGPPGL